MVYVHVANSRIGFSLVPRLQYGTGGLTGGLGMRLSWRCERPGYCVLPGVICLHIVSLYFLLGSAGRRSGGKGRMGGIGARQLLCIQHTEEQLKAISTLYRVCQPWLQF